MAEEPISPGELTALHARISVDLAALRRRLRPPQVNVRAHALRNRARIVHAAVDTLRAVRDAPNVAARVGVALLVVAGVAALLARRRGGAKRTDDQP